MMAENSMESEDAKIQVTVIGQEGDDSVVTINPHELCAELLRAGLQSLYGHPGPNPDEYKLVFNGGDITPLTQTIAQAGITNDSSVSIQPKQISRGGW